jgi:hypothetical protein
MSSYSRTKTSSDEFFVFLRKVFDDNFESFSSEEISNCSLMFKNNNIEFENI